MNIPISPEIILDNYLLKLDDNVRIISMNNNLKKLHLFPSISQLNMARILKVKCSTYKQYISGTTKFPVSFLNKNIFGICGKFRFEISDIAKKNVLP